MKCCSSTATLSRWTKLQIAQYVRDENIGLVGIGAMTRMIAKAYRIADAIRATGVPVVMGGPHVTELADEALGRDGGPRRRRGPRRSR
jgi:CO dehydrogenase/acetyl-CoA synthase alpha subunit